MLAEGPLQLAAAVRSEHGLVRVPGLLALGARDCRVLHHNASCSEPSLEHALRVTLSTGYPGAEPPSHRRFVSLSRIFGRLSRSVLFVSVRLSVFIEVVLSFHSSNS